MWSEKTLERGEGITQPRVRAAMSVGVDKESSILISLLKDAVGEASNEIENRKGKLDETTLKLCSEAVDAILPHCKTGVPEVTGA